MSELVKVGSWINPCLVALEEEVEFFRTRHEDNIYRSEDKDNIKKSSQEMLLGLCYFHMKLTELQDKYTKDRKEILEKQLKGN